MPFTKRSVSSAGAVALVLLTACDVPTDPLSRAHDVRAVTAQGTGDVYLMVQTDGDAAGTFSFTHTFGANSSPQVPSPFVLSTGQLRIFNSVAAGTYTVTQAPQPDWNLVAAADWYATECWDGTGESAIDLTTGAATINVVSGGFVVCTFVNAKRGTITIDKRENGTLPLGTPWSFELRIGASPTSAGVVRAAGTADLTTGVVTFSCSAGADGDCAESDGNTWLRAQEYQLCETGLPANVTNNLAGFTPAGSPSEGSSNGAECVSVALAPGQNATTMTLLGTEFVDNVVGDDLPPAPAPPPLEKPLGLGTWKKASSCNASDGAGAHSGAAQTLSSLPSVSIGSLGDLTCADIARLLSKQDLDGNNRANDGAYNLASHLLAAKLNQLGGAPVPACVAAAIGSADELLSGIGFTGSGDYLGPRSAEKATRQAALALAELLDRYNNSDLTVLSGNCG